MKFAQYNFDKLKELNRIKQKPSRSHKQNQLNYYNFVVSMELDLTLKLN